MLKIKFLSVILLCSVGIQACTQKVTNSTSYARSEMGRVSTIMKGVILDIREVNITGTNSGIGAGAGAIAGGTAGSSVGGNGRSNIIGAVGGAVIGGIAGAAAENAATSGVAYEFVVEQDNGQIIGIVQSNEQNLAVGEKVLISRSDRARLIRDNTKK